MARSTLRRLLRHFRNLKRGKAAGRQTTHASAIRLDRPIRTLEDRVFDADRAAATAALADALARGVIAARGETRPRNRLGLVA